MINVNDWLNIESLFFALLMCRYYNKKTEGIQKGYLLIITMFSTLFEKVKQAMHNPECLVCKKPLGAGVDICLGCLDALGFREPLPLSQRTNFQSHSATLFNAKVKQLVYGYKFFNKQENQRLLTQLLVRYWTERGMDLYDPASTWVVFVPPHGKRHPHMAAIARRFADVFGYHYEPTILKWRHETQAQRTLTGRRQRYNNVRDCMVVREPVNLTIEKRPDNVIILDDITTTGATLYEATQAFYRTGWFEDAMDYNQVIGLTITSVPMAFQNKKML